MQSEAGIKKEENVMAENNVERFEKVLKKKEHISDSGIEQMKKVAENLFENLENPANESGLLYGRVQSGKTNNTIMCIARLIDSGKYKLFVVLTSDNTSLYEQTLSRITAGLSAIGIVGYKDITRGNESPDSFMTKLGHSGAVVVCTKNPKNLKSLNIFLDGLQLRGIKAMIFDDEADFGSLNSKQNLNQESAVYGLIENLRGAVPDAKFVEVTATPQANLLQKPDDPKHPTFIVQIPPGDGYVGGGSLYDLEVHDVVVKNHRKINFSDIELITKSDDLPGDAPDSIYLALCTFFLGGAMKNLSSPDQSNFSMLVHISASRNINSILYKLVADAKDKISRVLHHQIQDNRIECILKKAYNDIAMTINSSITISYDEAVEQVALYIDQARPQKIISGRAKDDPKYDSFYNILIGGNRLSRGLTVKNLTVFYYAKVTGAPKVDTILQHSRIYGYRNKVLDIIRIFATEDIFKNLYDAYKSDQDEWEYVKNGDYKIGPPVLLSLRKTKKMRPTRYQVIPSENIIKYFPGKTYFLYRAKESNVEKIDEILKNKGDKRIEPEEIDLETGKRLIDLTDTYEPNQRWNKEAVKKALADMKSRGNRIYLIVRRDSDLMRDYRAVLSGEKESSIWKDDGPIIFMYRTSGKGVGWDGEIVWIPVLRIPKGSSAYYFTDREHVLDIGEE